MAYFPNSLDKRMNQSVLRRKQSSKVNKFSSLTLLNEWEVPKEEIKNTLPPSKHPIKINSLDNYPPSSLEGGNFLY